MESFLQRGRSLLVVVASEPHPEFEQFTNKVREYNQKEPFSFRMPVLFKEYAKVRFVVFYLFLFMILYLNYYDFLRSKHFEDYMIFTFIMVLLAFQ